MDFDHCVKMWDQHVKAIKKDYPTDTDLLTEASSCAAAAAKAGRMWDRTEESFEGVRKSLSVSLPLCEALSKEATAYLAYVKKGKHEFPPLAAEEAEKDIDDFLKAAKALKAALDKFVKAI